MKKLLLAFALAGCTSSQGAGTVGAITSPECIACAAQIASAVAHGQKAPAQCAPATSSKP